MRHISETLIFINQFADDLLNVIQYDFPKTFVNEHCACDRIDNKSALVQIMA